MTFIEFRPSKNKQRRYPVLVRKTEKYGEVISAEAISMLAKLVIIVGQHDSGKTRYLQKFYDLAEIYRPQMLKGMNRQLKAICRQEPMAKPLLIKQVDSQSDWFMQIADWYEPLYQRKFKTLTTSEKLDAVCEYLEQTRALLLVDDIEMMTGKKVQYVKRMVDSAYRAVVTCKNEVRIHPSLRGTVMAKCEQIVRLESQVSYDITPVVLAIMMVLIGFAVNPLFGAMLLLGGIGKLATGLNATRSR